MKVPIPEDGISVFSARLPHMKHCMLHTHPFHEFYFSLSSGGTQYAADNSYALRPGQLFSLPSGVPHLCTAWKSAHPVDSVVIYLHEGVFSERAYGEADCCQMLKALVRQGREGRHEIELNPETLQRLTPLLHDLCAEKEETPGYTAALKAGLQHYLVTLMRDPNQKQHIALPPVAPRERFAKLFHYLQTHHTEPQTVSEAAERVGLGRSHFHALFREASGTTFVRYLTRLRVDTARRLLEETDLPLTEVALASGFEQLAHFYRCFREHTGQPPGQYRYQNQRIAE